MSLTHCDGTRVRLQSGLDALVKWSDDVVLRSMSYKVVDSCIDQKGIQFATSY